MISIRTCPVFDKSNEAIFCIEEHEIRMSMLQTLEFTGHFFCITQYDLRILFQDVFKVSNMKWKDDSVRCKRFGTLVCWKSSIKPQVTENIRFSENVLYKFIFCIAWISDLNLSFYKEMDFSKARFTISNDLTKIENALSSTLN